MRHLLSIMMCLWASCAWAFPSGFIGAITQGTSATENPIAVLTGAENNGDPLSIGTGTVTVTNATHTTDYLGTADGAFLIDADGEFVIITKDNFGNPTSGKVSFRYKNTVTPSSYARFIAITYAGDTSNSKFGIHREGSNTVLSVMINSVFGTATIPNIYDGTWHLISFTWDSGTDTASVNIDGTDYSLTITAFTAPILLSSDYIYIGNRGDGLRFAGGAICDIKIYE